MKRSSRITAIILALMLTVCMMPTFAFADDVAPEEGNKETAEEVKEEVTEVVEDAEEEVLEASEEEPAEVVEEAGEAELAVTEETAELKVDETKATWNGTKVTVTGASEEGVYYQLLGVSQEVVKLALDATGSYDFAAEIDSAYAKGNNRVGIAVFNSETLNGADTDEMITAAIFETFEVLVNTTKAVSKDVDFKFELEKLYGADVDARELGFTDIKSKYSAALTDNTITVKKGQSTSEATDVLRMGMYSSGTPTENMEFLGEVGALTIPIVKMLDSKEYVKDPIVWGAFNKAYFEMFTSLDAAKISKVATKQEDAYKLIYFSFANTDAADAAIAQINAIIKNARGEASLPMEELGAYLKTFQTADKMTFNVSVPVEKKHHKKGVQTGDESGLMIWLTMFAIAGAAAGAVALKRK